jgi:alginate O-acetyltransferase complex protein AlgI
MVFSSAEFIFLFLPIVIAGYYLMGGINPGLARYWLILSSLFFYGIWEPSYLLLILGSLVCNYLVSKILRQSERYRKTWLMAGLGANIVLIGVFKYFDFIIENFNILSGRDLPLYHILLPLGISFFTFQQISYLVDTYHGKTSAPRFSNYCLFITFFPQLIAGPIVRHNEMMPQLELNKNSYLNWENIAKGLFVFTIGLCKKVIFADTFAVWANSGFDYASTLSFVEAWGTSLCYTFQLYFDFSGYADMAIGAALLLNIHLPINFNSPYKSASITEFWRRWHMTLSRWLKDYLYIPLGGNQKGKHRRDFNLIATMLIGGLWHGAAWNFVLWGGAHGFALALHRWWVAKRQITVHPGFAKVITFLFINFLWVPFRATSLHDTLKVWKGMFFLSENPFIISESASSETVFWLIIGAFIVFVLPNSMELIGVAGRSLRNRFAFKLKWRQAIICGILFGFSCLWMMGSHGTEFIYFNF